MRFRACNKYIVTFGGKHKRDASIRFKAELMLDDIVVLNMETASREWPTGGRPTND